MLGNKEFFGENRSELYGKNKKGPDDYLGLSL